VLRLARHLAREASSHALNPSLAPGRAGAGISRKLLTNLSKATNTSMALP
jgi:hypothetical protein